MRAGYLLLLAQEKVTQEKGTPKQSGLRASCPPTSRAGCGVRWRYIHVPQRTRAHRARAPIGLILLPPAGLQRGPGKAARSFAQKQSNYTQHALAVAGAASAAMLFRDPTVGATNPSTGRAKEHRGW